MLVDDPLHLGIAEMQDQVLRSGPCVKEIPFQGGIAATVGEPRDWIQVDHVPCAAVHELRFRVIDRSSHVMRFIPDRVLIDDLNHLVDPCFAILSEDG